MKNAISLQVWAAALLLMLTAADAIAQTASAESRLAFATASVKPSEPGALGATMHPLRGGQTYIAKNVSARFMIQVV